MKPRINFSLTLLLWLANGFFWLGLVIFLAWHVQAVFWTDEDAVIRLDPATSGAWPSFKTTSLSSRNPFDPNGAAWQEAGHAPPAPKPGQVQGIMLMPGVGVALTDRGAARPGETLDAGRLLAVKAGGVLVDTTEGPRVLTLPGSNYPTLQQLNQANKPRQTSEAAATTLPNQGKP